MSSPPKSARPKSRSPEWSMLPSILFPEKMATLNMFRSTRVLAVAVGGRFCCRGENIHRREWRTALALQVGKFGLGLRLGVALANFLALVAELGARDLAIDARLREH